MCLLFLFFEESAVMIWVRLRVRVGVRVVRVRVRVKKENHRHQHGCFAALFLSLDRTLARSVSLFLRISYLNVFFLHRIESIVFTGTGGVETDMDYSDMKGWEDHN